MSNIWVARDAGVINRLESDPISTADAQCHRTRHYGQRMAETPVSQDPELFQPDHDPKHYLTQALHPKYRHRILITEQTESANQLLVRKDLQALPQLCGFQTKASPSQCPP